jgi:hypothetical protein
MSPTGGRDRRLGPRQPGPTGDSFLLVAPRPDCVYGPVMVYGVPISWPARVVRMVMLALGIFSVPSVGLNALQRPHCAQHELVAQHGGHGAEVSTSAHGHGRQTWEPQQHHCPHCPASECGRAPTCTGSSSTCTTPIRTVAANFHAHRVPVPVGLDLPHSASSTPDTPPPQLIA